MITMNPTPQHPLSRFSDRKEARREARNGPTVQGTDGFFRNLPMRIRDWHYLSNEARKGYAEEFGFFLPVETYRPSAER